MKINIEIPESINDVKLKQWQKYTLLIDEKTSDEFANRKALEIFYGIDGKHYNGLKVKDIEKIMGELIKALSQKPTIVRQFELSGINYGFIPNMDDITFGEFVDLDKYSSIKDYHKLMSILYRPITETYKDTYLIEKYKGSNERMADMPLGVALSASAFFFDIAIQLTRDTLKSLKPQEEIQKKKRDLAVNGLGILASTPYQMATFLNTTK